MRHQRFASLFALLLFSGSLFATPRVQDRISSPINDAKVSLLKGDLHPRARTAFDQGSVPATFAMQHLLLSFKRSAEQDSALDQLIAEQQIPASPKYHKWLTPEEFGDQFGLSQSDYAKVVAWLQSRGLAVSGTSRSRTWIAFDGTAAQVAAVFHTQIHQYLVNGKLHYANATEPAIPSALADVVAGVRLHNFKPKARSHRLKPNFTSDQSSNHYLSPDDFATIYDLHGLYNAGIDGTGQKIAVMGQTKVDFTNVTTFRTLSGLPTNAPKDVPIGVTSSNSGDLDEAYLDIEWAGAVAPKAQIIYVHADSLQSSGAFDALNNAITNNLAPVISISYGDCEANFSSNDVNTITGWLKQANAQGQTVVTPSGDDGAADCDYPATSTASVTVATHGLAVDIPSSFPYATAVGGTTFNEGTGDYWNTTNNSTYGSAKSYIPEVAWNDTLADIANGGTSFSATGGGKSKLFPKPSWQTGTGVPADNARFVPDIAFAASVDHDGYLTCAPGFCVMPTKFPDGFRDANNQFLSVVGGTSAGVPAFAGIVALINQKMGESQGNLNPVLYSLASTNPSVFHDVTTGDNKVPCASGSPDCPSGGGTIGFLAGTGYDMTTGLGSVDAGALVNAWPGTFPDFNFAGTSPSTTLAHGTSGTQTLTFTPLNGYSGNLTLTCKVSSGLGGTTCSLPATVAANGTATLTINASSSLASLPRNEPFGWQSSASFALFAGVVVVAGTKSRKKAAMLLTLLIIAAMISMVACGGGGSTSSSGGGGGSKVTSLNGDIIVTATDGTIAHSVRFNLTVN